jgi:serine/threonine protein kinase
MAVKKIERFILRDVLSDGPAGTVYRADEILPGDNRRTVAVKVLPQLGTLTGESPAEQRFFGEVRVLAQLAVHPNIVTIYAMGLTDGFPWLAMEYSSNTLAQRISDVPATPEEVIRLIEQIARGLAAMHALKPALIHQDLKPANVLVDAGGNYRITDFSLATVVAANRTHGLATVRYAAPEMLSSEFGRVSPATDLYALGHMAYEFALGDKTCRQQFPAVYEGNTHKDPPPNKWMMWHASINTHAAPVSSVVKGFPPTLSEAIGRLMAKSFAERYGSADELLGDLRLLRQEVETPAIAPTPVASTAPSPAVAPIFPAAAPPRPAGAPRSGQAPIPLAGEETPPPPSGPGPSAPNPASRYWVRLRGKVTGPFDLATLQRQAKQGHLSRLHQVSADQVTWKQASDIEGLYGPTIV